MQTAKLFKNGRSQAVRLPKEMQFSGSEVFIKKVGDHVELSQKPKTWEEIFERIWAVGSAPGDIPDVSDEELPRLDQVVL
jgi:antitoxin VapB